MANGQYVGVNGVARKVTSPYIGVAGVARKVTTGYVGVNGVARLFFAPEDGGAVVLEVEKITSNTYASLTTYTAEEFILLDIYPKTNGTVKVTYGGLTKTITDTSGAEEPNAQQVFFGTFNGVSDSVTTPESGDLTITGDCYAFGVGEYATAKAEAGYCNCIIAIKNYGDISTVPPNAFRGLTELTEVILPETVVSIGTGAFVGCSGLVRAVIPSSVSVLAKEMFLIINNSNAQNGNYLTIAAEHPTYYANGACVLEKSSHKVLFGFSDAVIPSSAKSIGEKAFYRLLGLSADFSIPNGVESVGEDALYGCESISKLTLPSSLKTIDPGAFWGIAPAAEVVILATTPPSITAYGGNNKHIFTGTSEKPKSITVPKGCGAAYRSAGGWSTWSSVIVEAS